MQTEILVVVTRSVVHGFGDYNARVNWNEIVFSCRNPCPAFSDDSVMTECLIGKLMC